jgi:'Cold-shock' DNA-binding domain
MNPTRMMASPDKHNSFVRIEDLNQQVVNPDSVKVTGTIKFFFENENYGFLLGDQDGKDVFFHLDDLKECNVTKEQIIGAKENFTMRFAYNKLAYFGKYGLSMKAINIDFVELKPNAP